jgi:hypothetical protein
MCGFKSYAQQDTSAAARVAYARDVAYTKFLEERFPKASAKWVADNKKDEKIIKFNNRTEVMYQVYKETLSADRRSLSYVLIDSLVPLRLGNTVSMYDKEVFQISTTNGILLVAPTAIKVEDWEKEQARVQTMMAARRQPLSDRPTTTAGAPRTTTSGKQGGHKGGYVSMPMGSARAEESGSIARNAVYYENGEVALSSEGQRFSVRSGESSPEDAEMKAQNTALIINGIGKVIDKGFNAWMKYEYIKSGMYLYGGMYGGLWNSGFSDPTMIQPIIPYRGQQFTQNPPTDINAPLQGWRVNPLTTVAFQ